jgi:hypothetical protein
MVCTFCIIVMMLQSWNADPSSSSHFRNPRPVTTWSSQVSSSSLHAAALLSKNMADGRRKSVSDSSGKQILAGKFGSASKKTALAEMSEMELEGMSILIGASRY